MYLIIVIISWNKGRLSSSVYRKPTTNDRYLDFKSNNPIAHKISTAKTV